MFKDIEKNYKHKHEEWKFNVYYWFCASILFALAILLKKYITIIKYIFFPVLLLLVVLYFIVDYKKIVKTSKRKKSIKNKIITYVDQCDNRRLNNLVSNLKRYDIKTKSDVKIILDYFNGNNTVKIESSFMGWVVSVSLTLVSFIEIVYNEKTKALDYTKIEVILGSTIGVIIPFVVFVLVIKFIINRIFFSKEQIRTNLVDDLFYIYIHFNNYKNQLSKKN